MRRLTIAFVFLAACSGGSTTLIDEMKFDQLPSYLQTNIEAVCEIENGPEYGDLWTSPAECEEAKLAEEILGAKAFFGIETVEGYLKWVDNFGFGG